LGIEGAGTWIGLVEPGRLRRRRLEAEEALFRQGDAISGFGHTSEQWIVR